MKNICLLLILLLAASGCRDEEKTLDGEFTTNLKEAQKLFTGTWKLIQVKAMIPNPPIPNVQMVISGNQITLLQDDKQTDKVEYDIVKNDDFLILITNALPRSDNWYLRNPVIKISSNQLFLDTGMAMDLPGYTFEKIK